MNRRNFLRLAMGAAAGAVVGKGVKRVDDAPMSVEEFDKIAGGHEVEFTVIAMPEKAEPMWADVQYVYGNSGNWPYLSDTRHTHQIKWDEPDLFYRADAVTV